MYYSGGFLRATDGPFADRIFFAQPVADVVNRIQFQIFTWQGSETEDGGGGWWHLDSIIWDRDKLAVYTEVTAFGGEIEREVPWPRLDEDEEEQRQEELYDRDLAWKWVSSALSTELGFELLKAADVTLSDIAFQRELKKHSVGQKTR